MIEPARFTGEVIGHTSLGGSASITTTARSTTAYLGECFTCEPNRPVRVDLLEDKGRDTVVQCWDCHSDVAAGRLVAVTTDEDCSAECRMAHGPVCRCACNAVNHARVWGMRLRSEEMTEAEAMEQLKAMLKYWNDRVRVLQRLAKKEAEEAIGRNSAFEAWADSREEFLAELLSSKDTRLAGFQTMIDNSNRLNRKEEALARSILAAS